MVNMTTGCILYKKKTKMKKNYAVFLLLFGMAGLGLLAATIGLDQMVTQTVKKVTSNPNSTSSCEITRKLGVFTGRDKRNDACVGVVTPEYSIFDTDVLDFSRAILYLYIAFICAAMIPGLVTVAVALYNVFSRPYQTFADIPAFMLYFALTGGLSILGMVMYLVLWLSEFQNSLPQTSTSTTILKGSYVIASTNADMAFWLLCGAIATTIFGTIVAVLANKDARRMKENEDFIEQKGGNTNDIFSL